MTALALRVVATAAACAAAWLGWQGGERLAAMTGLGEFALLGAVCCVFLALGLCDLVLNRLLAPVPPHQ